MEIALLLNGVMGGSIYKYSGSSMSRMEKKEESLYRGERIASPPAVRLRRILSVAELQGAPTADKCYGSSAWFDKPFD